MQFVAEDRASIFDHVAYSKYFSRTYGDFITSSRTRSLSWFDREIDFDDDSLSREVSTLGTISKTNSTIIKRPLKPNQILHLFR